MNENQNLDRNNMNQVPVSRERETVDSLGEPVVRHDVDPDDRREPINDNDVSTGAQLGGAGGAITGALAGAALGPVGALGGAVIGGLGGAVASAAAVSVADQYDNDYDGNRDGVVDETGETWSNRDITGRRVETNGDVDPRTHTDPVMDDSVDLRSDRDDRIDRTDNRLL